MCRTLPCLSASPAEPQAGRRSGRYGTWMLRPSLALSLLALIAVPTAAQADIIVQRAPGASAAALRADADVRLGGSLPIARTQVGEAAPGQSQADALAALSADPDVVYAEADQTAHALTNDTYWG